MNDFSAPYKTVCGVVNPFEQIPGIETWGATATEYQTYMLNIHSLLPVDPDITVVTGQMQAAFLRNREKYNGLYRARAAVIADPLNGYTETTERTKTGTDTRTDDFTTRNSGTDTTSQSTTETTKENTYENATLRDTGQATGTASGSITHGKTTTNGGTAATEYDTTETTTKTGTRDDAKSIADFRRIADWSLFEIIINDVIAAITKFIY